MWRKPACTAATTVSSAIESLYCQVPWKASVIRTWQKVCAFFMPHRPTISFYMVQNKSLQHVRWPAASMGIFTPLRSVTDCGSGLGLGESSLQPSTMKLTWTDPSIKLGQPVPYNLPLICSMEKVSIVNFKTKSGTDLILYIQNGNCLE